MRSRITHPGDPGNSSMENEMRKQIIKGWGAKRLFTPHKPGIGISYQDSRFGRGYDIGICTTSTGRVIITWGLSASREELITGVTYVQVAESLEAILEEGV